MEWKDSIWSSRDLLGFLWNKLAQMQRLTTIWKEFSVATLLFLTVPSTGQWGDTQRSIQWMLVELFCVSQIWTDSVLTHVPVGQWGHLIEAGLSWGWCQGMDSILGYLHIFQASVCVIFANISLANKSHMSKANDRGQRDSFNSSRKNYKVSWQKL